MGTILMFLPNLVFCIVIGIFRLLSNIAVCTFIFTFNTFVWFVAVMYCLELAGLVLLVMWIIHWLSVKGLSYIVDPQVMSTVCWYVILAFHFVFVLVTVRRLYQYRKKRQRMELLLFDIPICFCCPYYFYDEGLMNGVHPRACAPELPGVPTYW